MVWKIKPIEEVKKELNEKYEYISIVEDSYVGYDTKCDFIDKNHGLFKAKPFLVLKGKEHHWKRRILNKQTVKSMTAEMFQFQLDFKKINITLYKETYINTSTKCKFSDPEYGDFEAIPSNIAKGMQHPLRARKNAKNKLTKSSKEIEHRAQLIHKNITLDHSTYKNVNELAKWNHPKFGEWWAKPANILYNKTNHPRAFNGHLRSQEIANWLKTLNLEFKQNQRILPNHRELDYLINGDFAIEYCGLWWHREEEKGQSYHKDKMVAANSMGIQLLTIFEDEWLMKQDIVKSIIKSKLNLNPRIKAQKCKIKELKKEEWIKFLTDNHLQGANKKSIYGYGLFNKDELVAVITANTHHRNNDNKLLVLDRMAFKKDLTVEFGSSRLFHYFKLKAKQLGYTKIVSWSDNRYSNGNVYEKLGFKKEEELRPDYSYCKRQHRVSKQSMKKTAAERLEDKTEKQLRDQQGWFRIFDCGKIRWSFNI